MNIEWPYSDLFECCFDIGNGFFPVFLRKYFKHQMVDRWFSPILWLCYSEYLTEYNCTSSTEISLLHSFNFYTRQLFILQEKILYFFFLFYYCYISCSNLLFICLKRDKHFDQKFEQKFSFIYIYFHRSLLISSKYKLLQWLIEE